MSHRNISLQTCVVCKFVDTKRLFRISQTAYIFSKNYKNMIANLVNCHGDKRITQLAKFATKLDALELLKDCNLRKPILHKKF